MSSPISYFGIRHHGPGSARSVLRALEALQPDCVLLEGPAGSEPLLAFVDAAGMQPPVALLSHCPDEPELAVFHPYAVFSPEWQALQWAVRAGVPVHFIDVPAGVTLAWMQAERAAREAGTADEAAGEATDEAAVAGTGAPLDDAPAAASPCPPENVSSPVRPDPLDWLAEAAGYGDGEAWWNHMAEERSDSEGLFEAIAQAMTELRDNAQLTSALDPAREAVREAHMRQSIRAHAKQGRERIAVVCGAWHVPALADQTASATATATATADQALLKGLAKLKTHSTWIPWTYRHLSMASGYGAGVAAPGWYEHIWRQGEAGGDDRAVGWFARVARVLRAHELDCSSAHLIEAARLADTLAALRQRPQPGLAEFDEAILTVICHGNPAPMRLIHDTLRIGDVLGGVPGQVPTVPLQRDLEAEQKRLRLKPEALARTLDLDLRKDIDLQRSHLLHRLHLLGIEWGQLARTGHAARGTFHEIWELAWNPHYAIDLIVASRHGHTLARAATACALETARAAGTLEALTALIDRVLLANLPDAVTAVTAELEARAATDADPLALLGALPALANVYRYGNVRNTDAGLIGHLFDSMVERACIGLPLAVTGLDDEAAAAVRATLLAGDRAIALRQGATQTAAWQRALHLVAHTDSAAALLRGLCTRLLLDAGALAREETQRQLTLNLSQGAEPLAAAHWLDGFLNRNAAVLLHGDVVWPLLDEWLTQLSDAHFVQILPLVRRSFAEFAAAERRDLAQKARQPAHRATAPAATPEWDETRALRALPLLRELLAPEMPAVAPPSPAAMP